MFRLPPLFLCWLTCAIAQGEPLKITGRLTNPDGSAAANSSVTLFDRSLPVAEQRQVMSDQDGRFEFSEVRSEHLQRLSLRVLSSNRQSSVLIRPQALIAKNGSVEVNEQLKPVWNIYFKITDKSGRGIESATVLVKLRDFQFFYSESDASGRAEFILPNSEPIEAIAAFKDDLGFDFHAYERTRIKGQAASKSPLRYPDETAETLVLSGARKVVVQVIDEQRNPISNAVVSPSIFTSANEPTFFSPPAIVSKQLTDANGMASFNWLPTSIGQLYFDTRRVPDFLDSSNLMRLDSSPLVITLERPAKIRGKVRGPDGRGQAGVQVEASGSTYSRSFNARTETDREGNYELSVQPNGVYIVGVLGAAFVAPYRDGIPVPRGATVESIDFQLEKPTWLTGRMLDVETRNPVANEPVQLVARSRQLTTDETRLLDKSGKTAELPPPQLHIKTNTDGDGSFDFFVSPGKYSIRYMGQEIDQTVAPLDQVTVELPAKAKLTKGFTGLVIDSATRSPIANANVYDSDFNANWQTTTDERGQFKVQRSLEGTFMLAFTTGYAIAVSRMSKLAIAKY